MSSLPASSPNPSDPPAIEGAEHGGGGGGGSRDIIISHPEVSGVGSARVSPSSRPHLLCPDCEHELEPLNPTEPDPGANDDISFPPPAPTSAIESLPFVEVSDRSLLCPICTEAFPRRLWWETTPPPLNQIPKCSGSLTEEEIAADFAAVGSPFPPSKKKTRGSNMHHRHDPLFPCGCGPRPSNRSAAKMPCGHLYHHGCISEWLSNSNSCPVCRRALPAEDPSSSCGRGQDDPVIPSKELPTSSGSRQDDAGRDLGIPLEAPSSSERHQDVSEFPSNAPSSSSRRRRRDDASNAPSSSRRRQDDVGTPSDAPPSSQGHTNDRVEETIDFLASLLRKQCPEWRSSSRPDTGEETPDDVSKGCSYDGQCGIP